MTALVVTIDSLVRQAESPKVIVLYTLLVVSCIILFSITLEVLITLPFRLKKYSWLILRTNLVTQIVMWLPMLIFGFSNSIADPRTFALKIGTCIIEYLYYKRKMLDIPHGRILLYTLTAHSIPIILGPVLLLLTAQYWF